VSDLFILAAEPSADLHGAHLIDALHSLAPHQSIAGVLGPRMREKNVQCCYQMEELQVMGFTDVIAALPRLFRLFRQIRQTILELNPRTVVCIDYPGFNIRLEQSLRKKGYRGRLIHYICPTVWAWGKKRIPVMAKNLDLLLTLFPFEKDCFAYTSLPVQYVGHPLVKKTDQHLPNAHFHERYHLNPTKKILALFPGSRQTEIERNFPLQIAAAKEMLAKTPDQQIAVSLSHPQFRAHLARCGFPIIEPEHNYDLMRHAHLALATSGTVTLELALFQTPTVAQFAIRPFDVFLAQKIFRINLPHYVIVNILMRKTVFPELFGPHLTLESLLHSAKILWNDEHARQICKEGCHQMKELLGNTDASHEAARAILYRS